MKQLFKTFQFVLNNYTGKFSFLNGWFVLEYGNGGKYTMPISALLRHKFKETVPKFVTMLKAAKKRFKGTIPADLLSYSPDQFKGRQLPEIAAPVQQAKEEQPRKIKRKYVPGPIREILECEESGNLYMVYEWEADNIFEKLNDQGQHVCIFTVNGFFYQGLITITMQGPNAFSVHFHETDQITTSNKTHLVTKLHTIIQTGKDKKEYRRLLKEWIHGKK